MLFRRTDGMRIELPGTDDKETNRKNTKLKRKDSPWERRFRSSPPKDEMKFFGKASVCTLRERLGRAALTVEAAMVLPLFLFGLITMISLMDFYQLQTVHLARLCSRAKLQAMLAAGGEEEVTLYDAYTYSPPGLLLPLGQVPLHSRVTVHAWVGEEAGAGAAEGVQATPEPMFYRTATGEVLHKSLDCTYLHLSVRQISGGAVLSARNSSGESYHPCEACSRGQAPASIVYITENGTRFHNSASCSCLKRTVRLVPQSQAGDCHLCSRCG